MIQGHVYYSDRFWNVSWTKKKQKERPEVFNGYGESNGQSEVEVMMRLGNCCSENRSLRPNVL